MKNMTSEDNVMALFGSRPTSSASFFEQLDHPTSPVIDPDLERVFQIAKSPANKQSPAKNGHKSFPQGLSQRGELNQSPSGKQRSSNGYNKKGQNYFQSQLKNETTNRGYVDESELVQQQRQGQSWRAPWSEKQKFYHTAPMDPVKTKQERQDDEWTVNGMKPLLQKKNYYGKKWDKRNPSYVDESLFSSEYEPQSFDPPWGDKSKYKFVYDCTDYKALEIKKQLKAASKAATKKGKKGPLVACEGDRDPIEQIERNIQSQLSVYGEQSRPQSRTGHLEDQQSTSDNPKKGRKKMFKESYVDEMLFGPKPKEPDFPAPWEEVTKKPKPHIFDGTSACEDRSSRPASAASSRAQSSAGSRRNSTASQKPWR